MSYSYIDEVWEKNDPMKKISKKISKEITEEQSEKIRTDDLLGESTDIFDPSTSYSIDASVTHSCSDFMDHIKSCKKCSHRLKTLTTVLPREKDDWKETVIIVVGVVIIIMLLFMMSRQFSK